MKTYTHLPCIERAQIDTLLNQGKSANAIVKAYGRSRSTISRHVKLNNGGRVNRYKLANQTAKARSSLVMFALPKFSALTFPLPNSTVLGCIV